MQLTRSVMARWSGWATLAMFVVWMAVVLVFTSNHTMWRDEVRALTIATQGETVLDMLAGLRGEGHPALWYLLLRAGHAVVGDLALPGIALLIAVASAVVLLWRSPFNVFEKAGLLFAKFVVFDYSVVARNYGVSMLLAFAFAALYPRWRDRGIGLGLILLLLANTNVHSVVLGGALALMWGIDILRIHRLCWTSAHTWYVLNAILFAVGVALCALTVYPPFNDAAPAASSGILGLPARLLHPGPLFPDFAYKGVPVAVVSLLILGSLLAVSDNFGRLAAAAASFVGLTGLFYLVYAGGYRHEALLLVLLTTLIWIGREDPTAPVAGPRVWARRLGICAFALLIAMQDLIAVRFLRIVHTTPISRARDFGDLMRANPNLASHVVIATPEYLIEALPYYAPNPVYRVREEAPGPFIHFRKSAKSHLDLDDLLAKARQLALSHGGKVLVLVRHELREDAPLSVGEGYNWTFTTTPEQVRRFRSQTRLVEQMGHALTDETFAVYEYQPSPP